MTNMPPATSDSPLVQFGTTFKTIIVSPHVFFDSLPVEGDIKPAFLFYLAISAVYALGNLIVSFRVMQAVQTLFIGVIFGFVWSGFVYLLAKALGGKRGYVDTYRSMAYASAPNVFAWIPLIQLIAGAYALYLMTLGLVRVHELPANRAWVVVGIATATIVGIAIMVVFFSLANLVKPQPGI